MEAGLKECEENHSVSQDPDAQLMLAFQAGHEESFVQLYEKYKLSIFNFVRRILLNDLVSWRVRRSR